MTYPMCIRCQERNELRLDETIDRIQAELAAPLHP